jgi:hypothetical protein
MKKLRILIADDHGLVRRPDKFIRWHEKAALQRDAIRSQ